MEWKKNAINGRIVAGGNGQGNRNDQLSCPTKVIVDRENDSLIISDHGNCFVCFSLNLNRKNFIN